MSVSTDSRPPKWAQTSDSEDYGCHHEGPIGSVTSSSSWWPGVPTDQELEVGLFRADLFGPDGSDVTASELRVSVSLPNDYRVMTIDDARQLRRLLALAIERAATE